MLIIVALALVVLLGASAFTIDLGRRAAQERYLQNAADAAALAACNALIDGDSDATALQRAREIATINLEDSSPAGSNASIAAAGAEEYLDGHHGNAYQLTNGAVIADDSVFVGIDSQIDTTVGRVLGRENLPALGRARCALEAQPALPFVARRYQDPPGPGGDFLDHLATEGTSGDGMVDPTGPRGYNWRVPASELVPGPEFDLFSNTSNSTNVNAFRGFITLDVRDFTDEHSRQYYNGVTETMTGNPLKNHHAEYITNGYKGPAIPAVDDPPTGGTQVGIMTGTSAAQTSHRFRDKYAEGDRLMFAVYNGTVMAIPDFSIQPPVEIALPATTTTPVDGPTFEVSRNADFSSVVNFRLLGDDGATATGHPEYDILPDPSVTPPATGDMDEPTFSPDGFVPASGGTDVDMLNISTEDIAEGVYTVWLEGNAAAPYDQIRRQPIPVRVGTVDRDFSLDGSILDGEIESLGGSITLPLTVSTGTGAEAWHDGSSTDTTNVELSWDVGSLTDCSHHPKSLGTGSISITPASVTPTSGAGSSSSLTINAGSLASGCYLFTLRAHGVNADGQPVVRLEHVEFTVAPSTGPSEYVDIIGFAVFEITETGPNSFRGQAITGIHADPNALELRTAQQPRLIPWD